MVLSVFDGFVATSSILPIMEHLHSTTPTLSPTLVPTFVPTSFPTMNPTCGSGILQNIISKDQAFQTNDAESMKAFISVEFFTAVSWPYKVIADSYDPLEGTPIATNGNITIVHDCEVPATGSCESQACEQVLRLEFDSTIMCSAELVSYPYKLYVENVQKEVQVVEDLILTVDQLSQCPVVFGPEDEIEGAISLRTADYSAEVDRRSGYRVREKAYLQLEFQSYLPIETVSILEMAVNIESEDGLTSTKYMIFNSQNTELVRTDVAKDFAISTSLYNVENVVTHELYFHEKYFSITENILVLLEYTCKLTFFSEEDIQNGIPKGNGRRSLKHVTVQETFAFGSKNAGLDPLTPKSRRALEISSPPPLYMEILVLPFKCAGVYTSTSTYLSSIGSFLRVQCGEKSMFIECTFNGWDFANSSGDCEVLHSFTFNVEVRGVPVPTCENIVDTMNLLLGKSLQNSRCSRQVYPIQSPWKIANYEVTHTNYYITRDDIKSVLEEDSSSFKQELEKQTNGIRVGDVNDLKQHYDFVDPIIVEPPEFTVPPLTSTSERSTTAIPKSSTTTPVVAEITLVESSSGDDYMIHLIIGFVALICICVGQYFCLRLSRSVQKIQEVYTGETKGDEEAGSPKLIDLASDEGELKLKAAVSDEAVAINPSMFLGEIYDYYLTTHKTTKRKEGEGMNINEGKEGEGTNTTENNDGKFSLFE